MQVEERTAVGSILEEKLQQHRILLQNISIIEAYKDKTDYLHLLFDVSSYLEQDAVLRALLLSCSEKERYVVLALLALQQGPVLFKDKGEGDCVPRFRRLLKLLLEVEDFYKPMGGLIGYHVTVLERMVESISGKSLQEEAVRFLPPPYKDISVEDNEVEELIFWGINALEYMGELYAVGGAGDRLDLTDPKTGRPLPAARLLFDGRTLLEMLVRDIEAREYLYYKLYAKELRTPIVLMTSEEKMNDSEILNILEEAHWFHRGKENFFRIMQPQIPLIMIDGNWGVCKPLELYVKPGGHGVIWKLAIDQGAFAFLESKKREALIVRQINNPVAGIDYTLLSLSGLGMHYHMDFGFASCPTRKGAQEGMNVLKESRTGFAITNIEYTEMEKGKLSHVNKEHFLANTNILYTNIAAVRKASERLPLPGPIVNMKLSLPVARNGHIISLVGARLETTMQNIADTIEASRAFLIKNEREKTISVTKKSYKGEKTIDDTPEGAFYDVMRLNHAVLRKHCGATVPELNAPIDSIQQGPGCMFTYHPALGPLYSVIAQKIRGGIFHKGAELDLEIAECLLENIELSGSLRVTAERITSSVDEQGEGHFSADVGSVVFKNVRIHNEGVDYSAPNCYWKGDIARKESLHIILEGNAEFYAVNAVITGAHTIRVPNNTRAVASGDTIVFEPLSKRPKLIWQYSFEGRRVVLR